MVNPYVLESKIRSPRISGNLLVRQRIGNYLRDVVNYRLTILQAGAGYGKSTALAQMVEEFEPVIWYQISEEDQDPLVFLLHLCYATAKVFPDLEGLPISLLETWENYRGPAIREIVFKYLNAVGSGIDVPTVVILDDVHLVLKNSEIAYILDQVIGLAPPNLHFVLSSRQNVQLPNLFRWRSLGQVHTIDQQRLAFTEEEIANLFVQQYGMEVSDEEIEELYAVTEGWAISLQLIWQSLNTRSRKTIKEAISNQMISLDSLFEILAKDVMERQSAEIQRFLKETSVLRILTPGLCDKILDISSSKEMIAFIAQNDMFITDLGGDEYRYHPIFRTFLYQQLTPERRKALHIRAATNYAHSHELNAAIYHYLQAEDYYSAAELLNRFGGKLHAMGHLETLANYLDHLSPEILGQFPGLIFYLGDLARLHSRFQEAIGWYQQALTLWQEQGNTEGISRALRGQARVYLDTVNPSKAEELLQQALRLSDGAIDRETRSRLYQLLAENKLNAGKVDEAEKLREQAELLQHEGPDDSQLLCRVLLRTGRLEEARNQLEQQVREEDLEPVHLPRAHRETQLLLSLIYAFQGEVEKSLTSAQEGTKRGKALASPFVTAVGYMREGHALTMQNQMGDEQEAREKFEQVIKISHEISTPRLRVEAYWGLAKFYGFLGNLNEAEKMANEGIAIATQAGDEWIASLIRLAMGASCILANEIAAGAKWLENALRGFQECSDPFAASATRLWQCYGWQQLGEIELLSQGLNELLSTCQQNFYNYLLTKATMLGFPDERMAVPLLIWARENHIGFAYPAKLLQQMGLGQIEYHPGYRLNIYTLGQFEIQRGAKKVEHGEWRREKSRQLFQLLVTYRNSPLDREQICEYLWPDVENAAAERNFKVALNNLYRVLEPDRKAGEESGYVLREGTIYGLRPEADLWIDADQFETLIQKGEKLMAEDADAAANAYKSALDLYEGEYLPDARYSVWSAVEREHLAVKYLESADKFCELSLGKRDYHQVIEVCQKILSFDSCWERAYRHMMKAYDKLGDHGQVARIYQRCVETLHEELDVKPADETISLFRQLTESD